MADDKFRSCRCSFRRAFQSLVRVKSNPSCVEIGCIVFQFLDQTYSSKRIIQSQSNDRLLIQWRSDTRRNGSGGSIRRRFFVFPCFWQGRGGDIQHHPNYPVFAETAEAHRDALDSAIARPELLAEPPLLRLLTFTLSRAAIRHSAHLYYRAAGWPEVPLGCADGAANEDPHREWNEKLRCPECRKSSALAHADARAAMNR